MSPERQEVAVTYASDVSAARSAAKAMALAVGFSSAAAEEVSLAVSELASNLVKHAGNGTITLSPLSQADRSGIEIESHDTSPGIADVELALTDGFSTVGSLGYGLGTVNRLMDQLEITSGGGTHIVCRRFVRYAAPSATPAPLSIAAATRAHPLMEVNGDTFVIKRWGSSALVGIIDGLGHGPFALRAAQIAREFVESHYDQSLAVIFAGVERACRATRGVVMALARFDSAPDVSVKLTFASVGNVEARVFGRPESLNFIVRRGVLGAGAPRPVVTEHRWEPADVLVLHSDGVSSHWRWTDYPDLHEAAADVTAQDLLRCLAKDQDDATVLVVRGAAPQERA
jgi:anti-sigma regulatory factor (Ser/Thr protein kinase)/serine/threonine protein phosphatase PrpC